MNKQLEEALKKSRNLLYQFLNELDDIESAIKRIEYEDQIKKLKDEIDCIIIVNAMFDGA